MDINTYQIYEKGKIYNQDLENKIKELDINHLVIEMVASYGMAVGKSVFDTVLAIGRFSNILDIDYSLVYRRDVKMNLVGKTSCKDSDITQALISRFVTTDEIEKWGDYGKGTMKNKGFFHGFNNDIYQAYAVGVTWLDTTKKGKLNYEQVMNERIEKKRK